MIGIWPRHWSLMLNLVPGTLVTKAFRGIRNRPTYARILEPFTRQDVLGRTTHHYRVELLDPSPSGLPAFRNWPASHVIPAGPPPTTEAFASYG